ncbi:MAG TPA: hypothetical protein VHN80_02715, partial [Kineosporiaceae bacterium]|nr:hypothetical protein [Kineosporiaceae bacterium]
PTPTSFPPSSAPPSFASSFPSYAPAPPVRIDELGEWRPTEADLSGGTGPRGSTPIFDEISAWFSSAPASASTSNGGSGGLQVVDLRSGAQGATKQRVSRWDALHDDGWLAANERAAATPQIAGSTDAGLPRRRPGANQPPSATDSAVRPSAASREIAGPDANDVRRRLDGFQQGLRTARQTRSHVQEPSTSRTHARSHAATDRRSADDTKEIVFGAFYNGYLPHLLAQLMAHGARPAVAAEVAQDAMAAAYQAWDQIPAPEEWTRNWALNAFTNPTASGTRPWEAPPATGAPAPDPGSLFDSGH